MLNGSRPASSRLSLRYYQLQAKRRLAAGEFAALHEAQAVIAREQGHRSWAAFKERIVGLHEPVNPAVAQVAWLIARFRNADDPSWRSPTDLELREPFVDEFLDAVPA